MSKHNGGLAQDKVPTYYQHDIDACYETYATLLKDLEELIEKLSLDNYFPPHLREFRVKYNESKRVLDVLFKSVPDVLLLPDKTDLKKLRDKFCDKLIKLLSGYNSIGETIKGFKNASEDKIPELIKLLDAKRNNLMNFFSDHSNEKDIILQLEVPVTGLHFLIVPYTHKLSTFIACLRNSLVLKKSLDEIVQNIELCAERVDLFSKADENLKTLNSFFDNSEFARNYQEIYASAVQKYHQYLVKEKNFQRWSELLDKLDKFKTKYSPETDLDSSVIDFCESVKTLVLENENASNQLIDEVRKIAVEKFGKNWEDSTVIGDFIQWMISFIDKVINEKICSSGHNIKFFSTKKEYYLRNEILPMLVAH